MLQILKRFKGCEKFRKELQNVQIMRKVLLKMLEGLMMVSLLLLDDFDPGFVLRGPMCVNGKQSSFFPMSPLDRLEDCSSGSVGQEVR